jgi:adenylate cyclase
MVQVTTILTLTEITMNILAAMQVALTKGEYARLSSKSTKNLEAYLKYLKAIELSQQFNKEALALARRHAEETIALDPDYAMGYRALAGVTLNELFVGANKIPRAEALQQSLDLAQRAVALDPSSSLTHGVLGACYFMLQSPEKALSAAEKAIALGPNDALAYDIMGAALMTSEQFHDAIPMFQKSLRLSPIPISSVVLLRLGASYRFVGQNEEAMATFKRVQQLWPDNLLGRAYLAATYATVGRDQEARIEAAEVLRIDPNFTAEGLIKRFTIRNKQFLDQMVADLRKAGLKLDK